MNHLPQSESTKDNLVNEVIKDFAWRRRWRLLTWIAVGIFTTIALFRMLLPHGLPMWQDHIAVVDVRGEIADSTLASADKIIPVLQDAFENDRVKTVILDINSPGGSPTEADRIASEIDRLKKLHPKPIVAVINALGASAAYMIAIHADKIVSGRYSFVGSIGVIMTGWDLHKLADRVDVTQHVYASGPYKDMMNPLRQPRPDEQVVLQQLVQSAAKTFTADVVQHRGKKLKRLDIFTGQVWNGLEAKELGLVDEIGTIETVQEGYKLKVRRLGPATQTLLASSWLHEIGAGIGESLLKSVQPELRYGK